MDGSISPFHFISDFSASNPIYSIKRKEKKLRELFVFLSLTSVVSYKISRKISTKPIKLLNDGYTLA
jgi:hypothetical protein